MSKVNVRGRFSIQFLSLLCVKSVTSITMFKNKIMNTLFNKYLGKCNRLNCFSCKELYQQINKFVHPYFLLHSQREEYSCQICDTSTFFDRICRRKVIHCENNFGSIVKLLSMIKTVSQSVKYSQPCPPDQCPQASIVL